MTALLVASTGGHLAQLHLLRRRLDLGPNVTWLTFDSPQSRSLLAGEDVIFARQQEPRDLAGALGNLQVARSVLRRRRFDVVVSTGAGVAVPVLTTAAARGMPCHYIESATRVTGPSLTGRILARVPGVHTYTQHRGWAGGAWHYRGSVFDGFEASRREGASIFRVVVACGTLASFPFPRLVRRVATVLPGDVETLWQTGPGALADGPPGAHALVPSTVLSRAFGEADVVIAHAGTGTALACLEAGRCPVLVPRRKRYGEHVDDHQTEIATELDRRGLAIACEVEDLSYDVIREAAARSVSLAATPPPLVLDAPHAA